MKETYIHGHKVYYEDNAAGGADYLLRHLDDSEAKVFFDQAHYKGHIKLEDAQNRHYILSHNSNGTYGLEHKF